MSRNCLQWISRFTGVSDNWLLCYFSSLPINVFLRFKLRNNSFKRGGWAEEVLSVFVAKQILILPSHGIEGSLCSQFHLQTPFSSCRIYWCRWKVDWLTVFFVFLFFFKWLSSFSICRVFHLIFNIELLQDWVDMLFFITPSSSLELFSLKTQVFLQLESIFFYDFSDYLLFLVIVFIAFFC